MGWDIHVGCQYEDRNRQLKCGDDYSLVYRVGNQPEYSIDEPIAVYRNYNLFRPLIGAHNTKQHLDNEREQWTEFVKNRSYYGATSMARLHEELYPETDEPTDVINGYELNADLGIFYRKIGKDKVLLNVAEPIKHTVLKYSYQETIRAVSLQQLIDFCYAHPQYVQLGKFKDAANARYQICNDHEIQQQIDQQVGIPEPIGKDNFYIVYGFDY